MQREQQPGPPSKPAELPSASAVEATAPAARTRPAPANPDTDDPFDSPWAAECATICADFLSCQDTDHGQGVCELDCIEAAASPERARYECYRAAAADCQRMAGCDGGQWAGDVNPDDVAGREMPVDLEMRMIEEMERLERQDEAASAVPAR